MSALSAEAEPEGPYRRQQCISIAEASCLGSRFFFFFFFFLGSRILVLLERTVRNPGGKPVAGVENHHCGWAVA